MRYKIGQEVKYIAKDGSQQVGRVHAISQQETPAGIVTSASYLIDTGADVRVDKVPQYHPETGELLRVDKVRQPEQIELPEDMVKAV